MDGAELTQQLVQGKLSRRDFIKLGGVALFANIVAKPMMDKAQATVSAITNSVCSVDGVEISLAKSIFGNFKDNYKFTPGTAHYLYRGAMHPDDLQAAKTLECIGLTGIEKIEVVPEFIELDDLVSNFVCLGSPNSNFLTRQALQYFYKTPNPENGFIRSQDPFVWLPFEYALDADNLIAQGAIFKRYVKNQLLVGPNWGIKDTASNNILIPKTADDGKLLDDFLLITVIPNYFTKKAYDDGRKIIIFGGSHGSGTKAISLLFRDKAILSELHRKISCAPHWQALIKVSRVVHTAKKSQDPMRLEPGFRVEPVIVNFEKIQKSFPV